MAARITRPLIVVLTLLVSAWFFIGYGRKATTVYGDAAGYYWYLPATFIYHNHDSLNWLPAADTSIPQNARWYAATMDGNDWRTPTGKLLVQYTYGVALMEAPFFLLAHGVAHLAGLNTNGFTALYEGAIKLSTLVYAVLAMLLTYRLLRRHYSPNVLTVTVSLLLVGTNLFWFTLHQAGMAHIPVAFLYALLMWLTERLVRQPRTVLFAALGGVVGTLVLIRPTEIACVLIPLLYGVTNRASALARLRFLRLHLPKLVVAAAIAALPVIPQLLYWKYMAGSYLHYSYAGQEFFWLHPKILEGIFYAQNGWLYYSPLMAASLAGLLLWRRYRPWLLSLLALLPLYLWITYAWYCFNYINGLGSRPMIHLYPLLAFPLAAVLTWLAEQRWWVRTLAFCFLAMCIVLNLRWSVQQSLGLLKSEESNTPFNVSIFLRNRLTYDDLIVRDTRTVQPSPTSIQKTATLGYLSYDDSLTDRYVRDTSAGGPRTGYFYRMGEEERLPGGIKITLLYDADLLKGARWLRASGRFNCTQWPGGYWKHHLFVVMNRDGKELRSTRCQIINKIGISDRSCPHADTIFTVDHVEVGRWGYVWFYLKVPKDLRDGDEIGLDIWNPGHQEILIDDLKLEAYR